MTQYILKSALVVKIENRIKELQNLYKENEEKLDSIQKTAILLCIDECKVIISLLDTLEVKEVDLEEEIDKFYGMYRKDGQTFSLENNEECVDWKVDCNPKFEKSFAKYFFELGMAVRNKALKGEEV